MIITIDGPSGTGKTTIARLLAERLGFTYFDTGSMYRAFAWFLMDRAVDVSDLPAIEKATREFQFSILDLVEGKRYLVGSQDVTEVIRTSQVTALVSAVAALRVVRDLLSAHQRAYGKKGDAVFEGRDLGSVIFPQAEVKIFLTARAEVRAKRRYAELVAKNLSHAQNEAAILVLLNQRDELDSTREIAPLKCPADAITIDTSDLTVDQVVQSILNHINVI
ncbi:MAG: (d)CMP kinase [Chlamydiae bacterium]|nr:(d)CMP kinase [Chlamydiota bacterium]